MNKQIVRQNYQLYQLVRMVDYVTAGFNSTYCTAALFLDRAKPFDKVWLVGLVWKLLRSTARRSHQQLLDRPNISDTRGRRIEPFSPTAGRGPIVFPFGINAARRTYRRIRSASCTPTMLTMHASKSVGAKRRLAPTTYS